VTGVKVPAGDFRPGGEEAPRLLRFRLYLTPLRASAVFLACALANCILVAGTWLFVSYYRDPAFDWKANPWTRFVLLQLDLAAENVGASWYASMLLLAVAAAGVLCFVLDRSRPPSWPGRRTAWGWLAVALLFALLSMDELGTLHERLAVDVPVPFGQDEPLGIGVSAGIALLILAFGWLQARAVPWVLPFLVLGVTRLFSLPLHEQTTSALVAVAHETSTWTMREMAIVLQESAKLFGTLSFLGAMGVYLTSNDVDREDERRMVAMRLRTALLSLGALVAVFSAGMILAFLLPPGTVHRPVGSAPNWFPAAVCLLAALPCIQIHMEPRRSPKGGRSVYVLTAIYAVAVSGYIGTIVYAYGHWGRYYVVEIVIHALLAVTALVVAVRLARRIDSTAGKLASFFWGLLMAIAFTVARPWIPAISFVAFSALLLTLPLHLERRTRID
jgi:hypothetical protein